MSDFLEKNNNHEDISEDGNHSQIVSIVIYIAFVGLVILCLMLSITSDSGNPFFALYISSIAFISFGSIPCLISVAILLFLLYLNRLGSNNSKEISGSRHHNSEDRFELAPLLTVVGVSLVIFLILILLNWFLQES